MEENKFIYVAKNIIDYDTEEKMLTGIAEFNEGYKNKLKKTVGRILPQQVRGSAGTLGILANIGDVETISDLTIDRDRKTITVTVSEVWMEYFRMSMPGFKTILGKDITRSFVNKMIRKAVKDYVELQGDK